MQHQDKQGDGLYGALAAARAEGRRDLDGQPLDPRGQMAILEARARGVTDPEELRAAAREARAR